MVVSSLDTSSVIRRRPFLRGIAGTLALSLTGTATAAEPAYSPLGSVTIEGAKEAVVGANNVVYVAATDGFAIVDVRDPTTPSVITEQRDILAEVDGGPLRSIADVKIDGDRLLVAGPAYPKSGVNYLNAITVFDVSDPSDPELLRWKETEMYHHNVFIHDGIASSWVNPSTDQVAGAGKKQGARLYTFPEPALEEKRETTTQQQTITR